MAKVELLVEHGDGELAREQVARAFWLLALRASIQADVKVERVGGSVDVGIDDEADLANDGKVQGQPGNRLHNGLAADNLELVVDVEVALGHLGRDRRRLAAWLDVEHEADLVDVQDGKLALQ